MARQARHVARLVHRPRDDDRDRISDLWVAGLVSGPMITLYGGDCLTIMPQLPAASVDLILCDLPYGTTQASWDCQIPLSQLWANYRRLIKSNGAVVLTASQPFTSALIMSNPKWFKHEWIWHKNKASGHLNAKRAPMKAHESVVIFCAGQPIYNPQMTEDHQPMSAYYTAQKKNSENYGAQKMQSGGGATHRYPRSVQYFPIINNDNPEKTHSTQKPVALMEYLIKTYSHKDNVVLDNCMGSGTTGIACRNLNRHFIGIELDQSHLEMACERLESLYF